MRLIVEVFQFIVLGSSICCACLSYSNTIIIVNRWSVTCHITFKCTKARITPTSKQMADRQNEQTRNKKHKRSHIQRVKSTMEAKKQRSALTPTNVEPTDILMRIQASHWYRRKSFHASPATVCKYSNSAEKEIQYIALVIHIPFHKINSLYWCEGRQ